LAVPAYTVQLSLKKGKAYGVTPYMDPKILNDHSYDLTKKSDIYSFAVLFWQLISCRPSFEFETDIGLEIRIINGKRETPISNTYVKLYQRMEIRCAFYKNISLLTLRII
jgi:hypothetical protein